MAKEIFEPRNDSLDTLLFTILDYLHSLPPAERTAVVAGIYCQNTGKFFVATSYQFRHPETNKLIWSHAEDQVLRFLPNELKDHRGQLIDPEAYSFISSLSPCTRGSSTRAHVSCTELLTGAGLTREHTGKIDNNAARTRLYEELRFAATLTTEPLLLAVCDDLYKFFIPFKKKGWTKKKDYRDRPPPPSEPILSSDS